MKGLRKKGSSTMAPSRYVIDVPGHFLKPPFRGWRGAGSLNWEERMKLSTLLKSAAIMGIATTFTVASLDVAEAKTRWKLHSAWSEKIFVIGSGPHNVADDIGVMSDGDFDIKVFEPGALVPANNYYEPVSKGALDAAWGTPGYHAGRDDAYSFFSAVPFGPAAPEYTAWFRYGGGQELAEELYGADNIKFNLCNMIAPESSGWFREPINSVEDLKGLKMRFFGLGAKVMEKFGVSTQLLAGGDIYPALERGTIDATEFSMPAMDKDYGFYQIAKHNYFPGWHQQATTGELLVNMDRWNSLTDAQRRMISVACEAQVLHGIAETEAGQGGPMNFHREKGVTIHRWPDEMIDQFRAAWEEVEAELIGANPRAAKVHASYKAFRDEFAVWRENGYLR